MKRVISIVVLVILSFPLTYFVETHLPHSIIAFMERLAPTLFIAAIEELIPRLIPLMLVYTIFRETDVHEAVSIGAAAGLTFGVLELFTKTMNYGFFSITIIAPIFVVHVVNGLLQSYIINFSYKKHSYGLIPIIYVMCTMWHFLYNYMVAVRPMGY